MSDDGLRALVIVYDEVSIALGDFNDLTTAHGEHRVGGYEAAVIETVDGMHEIVATTVRPREKATLRGAGLGLVIGVLFAPALAAALVGGSIGGAIGHLAGRVDAFKHADLQEAGRLVGEGPVHLLVIATTEVVHEIAVVAIQRKRRLQLPLESADVTLLKKELQAPGSTTVL